MERTARIEDALSALITEAPARAPKAARDHSIAP
jgi:hypothetical protein